MSTTSNDVSTETWSVRDAAAEVSAVRISDSRWRITTRSLHGGQAPRASCETAFPRELIERLLLTTGSEWICDAIARHEDPAYVQQVLRRQLFAYFPPDAFVGKRLLDFGCGNGASTMFIAASLPRTEVIGVELDASRIAEANLILAHRGLKNAQFVQSPSGDSLPSDVAMFDFVMLSAVFEHLLPQERTTVLPVVWSHVRPGGSVFVNQTPYRWHPYEHHSTGLWGINYLPRRAAHWLARRAGRGTRSQSWEKMLRGGIRGATERSIRAAFTSGRLADAEVLQPRYDGVRDRADYWLSCTSPRHRWLKRLIASAFRLSDRVLGTIPSTNVDVVLRKIR
jgi:cyclopropane fatty-acyl-phospholipid synthase-like methyltransferase